MATLKVTDPVPSPAEDCEQLRKAFQEWGTNEGLIISILGHRNEAQRKLIRETYAQTYGQDLLKDLDKELLNDFERAVLLWTLSPAERDAFIANEAIKRMSLNNSIIMEISSTRSSLDLLKAKQAYQARFKKSIEQDVAYWTSGDLRCLLVSLLGIYRYEGDEVNMTLAKSEAKWLHKKIVVEKAYSHEDVIRIVTTMSKAQLNATLNHYNNEFGNEIDKDLETDSEDEYVKLLRGAIKCLTYFEEYFEEVLRLAINKLGTDEGGLTRVVTTRAEVDLKRIAEEYQRRNSIPLDRAIANETSGEHQKFLLALLGHEE